MATLDQHFSKVRKSTPGQQKLKNEPIRKQHIVTVPSIPKPEISHEPEPSEAELLVLRSFDLDMTFGPCVGVPRADRWKRAEKYGLNPPEEVMNIIKKYPDSEMATENLWYKENL
eukprot:comp11869_c0_seq1/m.6506 comp11869_c0_seq1/g.6506  ORF comp11869_c0_seq1/g.6506 comp11869_c0_seq1/m.6506 type:complete len:115 (-) comp11869_c0_seq1:461-805(-)